MFEKCPNCLKRVVKGSKYCTHCGEKMPQVAKTKRRKVNKDFINVDFTDGKKILNRYQSYFIERIKDPTMSMKKGMNKESFQFGIFQLIGLLLINSLTVLILYSKANIGTITNLNISMLSLFLGTIILQFFYLLNKIISLYISTNYLKKVPTTIRTITSRIGGLASPQLILSIVLLFAAITKIGVLYYLALILLGLVSITSMSFYLLSIKNNSMIPNFYIVVFAIGVLVLLQIIMSSIIMRFSTNPQIYLVTISLLLGQI